MNRLSTLGMRMTHRMVVLFVACTLLPVALTLSVSYSHVQEALLAQRVGQLRFAAGSYANALVERLSVAELLARSIAYNVDNSLVPGAKEGVGKHFQAAVMFDRGGRRILFGQPTRSPAIQDFASLEGRLASGATVLFVPRAGGGPRSVWMVRAVGTSATDSRRIALELEPRYLWGAADDLSYQTDICALDGGGVPLNCTRELPQTAIAAVGARLAGNPKVDLAWEAEGVRYMSGYHELFLKGKYGVSPWAIVASQPEEYALAPVHSVQNVVLPIVFLGLLVAAFLGMVQVRRTLGPLKETTEAIARIGGRDFDARVPVDEDHEFGALAQAFNSMSERLGRQFHALEAHAEIDSVILSNVDMTKVAEIVLRRMAQVAHADRRLLLLADPEQVGFYRIHASDETSGADRPSIALSELDAQRLLAAIGGTRAAGGGQLHISAFAGMAPGAVFALPIVLGAELAGALVLGYNDDLQPDADEIPHLRELGDRVAVAVATAKRDQELQRRAHYDALTQLPNRLLGLEELSRAVSAAGRRERTLAVLFVDLDGFSAVNDTLGHATGDELLVQAADRLRRCVRKSDIVARLGGDEFAVVLPEVTEANDAALAASHLIETLSRGFDVGPSRTFISASVGIALYPSDGTSGEDLLRHADLAMYRAKQKGRGQMAFFEASMNAEVQRRLTLERELREALEQGQFTLYFQPQLDVASGRIVGAEALIRWIHPVRGLIPPAQFIGFAESSGLIEDIGHWVLKAACAQFVAWREAGLRIEHVSVNVSARQLRNPGFAQTVAEALRHCAIPAKALHLEITESAVIDQEAAVEANLASLNRLGTPLELDDFGTGYSSLAYLQRLPVAAVKLDLALIRTIETSDNNRAVVRAAIDMVHALGKTVVAEGVERTGQLAILARLGCDSIQGYYLSPPVPTAKFEELARNQGISESAAA